LAAAGIMVLQINDCSIQVTPDEADCNVRGYEAAINQLAADGQVDSSRIGIIGFSRSCLGVMAMLTTSSVRIRAASITDGVMGGYMQYITEVDSPAGSDFEATIGARPFGSGLQKWIARSPLFNMDRVTAALLVNSEGRSDLTFMWEPYAAMRYLRKPVDLILLDTHEHILTNPAVRMASQGGSVDWFRFWLQGYEDSDLGKVEQYRRWEQLCDMQVEQNPNQPAFCVRSKTQ